jgi:hypothetical protein
LAVLAASGNFTINGVAPGDYKLFAWEYVAANAWMNAEYLAPFENRGQAISVGGGASPTNIKDASNSGAALR